MREYRLRHPEIGPRGFPEAAIAVKRVEGTQTVASAAFLNYRCRKTILVSTECPR
jgi:hypothetical protein